MKTTLRFISLLAILTSTGTAVWGGTEKLSPELKPERTAGRQPAENVEVIVRYAVAPTEVRIWLRAAFNWSWSKDFAWRAEAMMRGHYRESGLYAGFYY